MFTPNSLQIHPNFTLCLERYTGLGLYSVSPAKKKSGTLDFRYFDIRKYSIFYFICKNIVFWKSDTKIIEIGWVVLILWSCLKT